MRRSIFGRGALVAAAAAVLAGVLAVPQSASAAPVPLTDSAAANALAADLGPDRTGGVYRDEAGQLVIAVTDEATAEAVEAAGGAAEIVTYSTAELQSVHDALDARIADVDPIPNTSWGIDPRTNRVTLAIFEGVSAADEQRLMDVVADYGDAVTIDRLFGNVQTRAYATHGGTGIHSRYGPATHNCTLGFNVRNSAGKKYFVTAGHCATASSDEYWDRNEGNIQLGRRVWYHFGGLDKDFAIMEYQNGNVAAYGAVNAFGVDYEITNSRYPDAGESVNRSGQRSSDLVGYVISPSVTVTVVDTATGVETVLKNMIYTNLCALGGDSGGPLWTGTSALGILSASSGDDTDDCRSSTSERSYYQPLQWIMTSYGLEVF